MDKLKAIVIDDSALYRKILSDILSEMPEVELLGTAPNGKLGLDKIERTNPDFITLDFEMPEFDGLEVLKRLKASGSPVKAVMVSAHTKAGASVTMQALEIGAFDFIAKPETSNLNDSRAAISSQLRGLVASLQIKKKLRPVGGAPGAATAFAQSAPPRFQRPAPTVVSPSAATQTMGAQTFRSLDVQGFAGEIALRMKAVASARPEIVAIGVSTGGPNALSQIIPKLPGNLRVPVVLVQHMPPVFTAALAESLGRKSSVKVFEAAEGMEIKPACVYIAPGGKHMRLEKTGAGQLVARITEDPPENNCRPAVDYLFRSVARIFGPSILGVILTGMGADGVKGMAEMKAFGAKTFAQDEASCVVYGMPMEAVKAGVVDTVLPLDRIADEIVQALR
jgi:two-component system chemotaxis response regulator CheB